MLPEYGYKYVFSQEYYLCTYCIFARLKVRCNIGFFIVTNILRASSRSVAHELVIHIKLVSAVSTYACLHFGAVFCSEFMFKAIHLRLWGRLIGAYPKSVHNLSPFHSYFARKYSKNTWGIPVWCSPELTVFSRLLHTYLNFYVYSVLYFSVT